MTRRPVIFACGGVRLAGTLDEASGSTGLLIVSGGNEIRCGAWNGQAMLAARLAKRGFPVFRFDRRGIGDSEGRNAGYRGSAEDIRAALAAFRGAAPHITRVIAWGNCDAASALMLGRGLGCDGLLLSNPWTMDQGRGDQGSGEDGAGGEAAIPPQALRAHYARRLRNPAALLRLLQGKVSLRSLARSLRKMASKPAPTSLGRDIRAGVDGFDGPVKILIAGRDRTGQAFLDQWSQGDLRLAHCPSASHSFVEDEAQNWLEEQIVDSLC